MMPREETLKSALTGKNKRYKERQARRQSCPGVHRQFAVGADPRREILKKPRTTTKTPGWQRWHELTADFLEVYEDMGGRDGLLAWATDPDQPGNRALFYSWLIKMIPIKQHHKVDINQYSRVEITAKSIRKIVAELSLDLQASSSDEGKIYSVPSEDCPGSIDEQG